MRAEPTIAATVWRPCNTFGESVPLFPILTISPHIDKNACKLRRKSAFTCKHWKKYLGNFLLVVGMMSERFFIYHWLSVSERLKTHWPPHLLQALNGRINFIFLSTVITKLNALSCRSLPAVQRFLHLAVLGRMIWQFLQFELPACWMIFCFWKSCLMKQCLNRLFHLFNLISSWF